MAFKRKRVYAPNPYIRTKKRAVRRRRVFKRKRRGGRSNKIVYTGNSSSTKSYSPYKSRKLSTRRYRAMLWRNTAHLMKWHSYNMHYATIATGATATLGGLESKPAVFNDFWGPSYIRTADTGINVPTFNETGNLIIRGGMIWMHLANENTEQVFYKIFLYSSETNAPTTAEIGATPSKSWDPRTEPDSARLYGKCIMAREGYLDNSGVIKIEHRLKPRKVDRNDWANERHVLYWIITCYNVYDITTSVTLKWQCGYDLSFCADASGTT